MAVAFCFTFLRASSGAVWIFLLCLAGIAAGLYLFVQGFRMLRFKRLILNTPLSRIHSASIGPVEVTGTPVGPYVLSAPITGDPCYYYRVRAWQWEQDRQDDKEKRWKPVLDETLSIPFYLEDSTGRVFIDPQGADLDVHRSFSDEISLTFFGTPGLVPPNVMKFLVERGLVPKEKLKLEERIIPQGFPLFVFGTLGENRATNQTPLSTKAQLSTTLSLQLTADSSPVNLNLQSRKSFPNVSPTTGSPLVNALNRIPGVHVETTQVQWPTDGSSQVIPDHQAALLARSGVSLPPNVLPSSAKPSADKSVFGDFDLHPRVAIGKGERNEPFIISGHSQKEVVRTLAWKSALYIWGGPVVTLACIYFLMLYLGVGF